MYDILLCFSTAVFIALRRHKTARYKIINTDYGNDSHEKRNAHISLAFRRSERGRGSQEQTSEIVENAKTPKDKPLRRPIFRLSRDAKNRGTNGREKLELGAIETTKFD